jgi:hypothetical protein
MTGPRLRIRPNAYPPLPDVLAVSCCALTARAGGGVGCLREGSPAGHGRPAEWARTTVALRSPGVRGAARRRPYRWDVPTLEEITYEAGRSALGDQESLVSGIRQRTGTMLAANAIVASFLGATTIRDQGLQALGWIAVAALVLALVVAAILLAPWRLKFAVDARELYDQLYQQAAEEADAETLGWLVSAGYLYHDLRAENAISITRMSRLSAALGVLMVLQTLAWLAALAVN